MMSLFFWTTAMPSRNSMLKMCHHSENCNVTITKSQVVDRGEDCVVPFHRLMYPILNHYNDCNLACMLCGDQSLLPQEISWTHGSKKMITITRYKKHAFLMIVSSCCSFGKEKWNSEQHYCILWEVNNMILSLCACSYADGAQVAPQVGDPWVLWINKDIQHYKMKATISAIKFDPSDGHV